MSGGRQGRRGDRRRQTGAGQRYALVFTDRLLVAMVHLRTRLTPRGMRSRRPTGLPCAPGDECRPTSATDEWRPVDPTAAATSHAGVVLAQPRRPASLGSTSDHRVSLVDALAGRVSAAEVVLVDLLDGLDLTTAARACRG